MLSDFLLAGLNEEQRAVCTAEGNVVAAAGAGSGKTRVLATRFAYLVIEKNISVDRILTLTFTRKAVTEMYSRIYETLVAAAENTAIPDTARKRAAAAVEHFADAAIQTIDSFSTGIVRTAGSRYGIRPDFSSGDQSLQHTARTAALDFVMAHRFDRAIQQLCPPGKMEEFAAKLFAETVIKYTTVADNASDFFSGKLAARTGEICDAWNRLYHDQLAPVTASIAEQFATLPDDKRAQPYGQKLADLFSTGEPEYPAASPENFETPDFTAAVKTYSDWLTRFSTFNQTLPGHTRLLQSTVKLIKGGSGQEGLLDLFASIAEYILKFPVIKQISSLLDEFLQLLNAEKRSSGQLSFADVSALALRILTEQQDIRELEKSGFDAIMIDEFQDNNEKNKELLYLLAEKKGIHSNGVPAPADLEENKLFFVGDEKQSIYKFRGADVSVFNRLAGEFGGRKMIMRTNYRSSPELISIFNTLFGGFGTGRKKSPVEPPAVFPSVPAGLQPFQASFTEENIALPDPAKTAAAVDPPLHLCLFDTGLIPEEDDDPASREEIEAVFTAGKIRDILSGTVQIPGLTDKAGTPRQPVPGDIAILLKSTTYQGKFEKQLRLHGIPYTSERLVNFFDEAPVNDLYNFLRLVVYPSDRIAYTALLTSPFVALSREEAEAVISAGGTVPFDSADAETVSTLLGETAGGKFIRAADFFRSVQSRALSRKVTETLTQLWYELGYRYETMWNRTVSLYGEQYDLLFETARTADENSRGPAWFVDQLAAEKLASLSFSGDSDSELDTKDISYPVERPGAVHIMTIHKSKGLEFPVVFIVNVNKKRKTGTRNTDYVFCSEDGTISLNTGSGRLNYFFRKQKEEHERKNDAELRRLLYVAVTRAEREVFITGSWDGPEKLPDYVPPVLNDDGSSKELPRLDNFYAVLEPLLSYYSAETEQRRADIPYCLEAIPYYTRQEANTPAVRQTAFRTNTQAQKQQFIEEIEPQYRNIRILTTPVIEKPYVSPSSLEKRPVPDMDPEYEPAAGAPYQEINAIVDDCQANGTAFGYTNFGTIAHAFMQTYADGQDVAAFDPPQQEISALTGRKGAAAIATIKTVCLDMIGKFSVSETGVQLSTAQSHRTEYQFKSAVGKKIIRGTIDLLYTSADGTATIVDYKTDQLVRPEIYSVQLACYRQAAAALTGVPEQNIRCLLYFLRYAKTVDITAAVEKIVVTENIFTNLTE
ncbi:MAG: UvrD-helicase domain-containing protein [Treponema sp.]|nr:UvrD-helicase domain-containing protein [Treponema sp.]